MSPDVMQCGIGVSEPVEAFGLSRSCCQYMLQLGAARQPPCSISCIWLLLILLHVVPNAWIHAKGLHKFAVLHYTRIVTG